MRHIVTLATPCPCSGRRRRTASIAVCPLIAFALACGLTLALSSTSQAVGISTYDFDSLTGSSGAGTALATQDNWKIVGVNAVLRNDEASFFSGGSGNVAYSGGDAQNSRINDANFSYSLANTPFVLSFKVRRNTSTASWFALGADANSSGTLGDVNNEVGPIFGYSTTNFSIRAANQGTITNIAHGLANDIIGLELVLRVDPTANSGNGAGSFSYRSLGGTYPSNPLIDVVGLQNINLGMLAMAAGFQTPSTWNGIYIRAQAGGALDNLTIVPEPGGLVLGLLGLVGMGSLIRRKKLRRA